jgi:hypothetical protein
MAIFAYTAPHPLFTDLVIWLLANSLANRGPSLCKAARWTESVVAWMEAGGWLRSKFIKIKVSSQQHKNDDILLHQ